MMSLAVVAACLAASGCTDMGRSDEQGACSDAGITETVLEFGDRMKQVSVTAPDSVAVRALRDAYASLVRPDLLEEWTADPASAPGRTTSSPWPERIEIRSIEPSDDGGCIVEGDVIYLTSVELTEGGAASDHSVTLEIEAWNGNWRIGSFEESDRSGAPAEGAAGSLYVTVPVSVRAEHTDGAVLLFAGTYTLRRAVVEGASEEERAWRIYSADMHQVSQN